MQIQNSQIRHFTNFQFLKKYFCHCKRGDNQTYWRYHHLKSWAFAIVHHSNRKKNGFGGSLSSIKLIQKWHLSVLPCIENKIFWIQNLLFYVLCYLLLTYFKRKGSYFGQIKKLNLKIWMKICRWVISTLKELNLILQTNNMYLAHWI